MDRKRIRDEVIEILAHKLHKLPQLVDGDLEGFDFEGQKLAVEITDNHLDIAEVAMDLEDAFGINFEDVLPGGVGMESIGQVIDFIASRIDSQHASKAG